MLATKNRKILSRVLMVNSRLKFARAQNLLSKVVVTSRRRSETAQNIPIPISGNWWCFGYRNGAHLMSIVLKS